MSNEKAESGADLVGGKSGLADARQWRKSRVITDCSRHLGGDSLRKVARDDKEADKIISAA